MTSTLYSLALQGVCQRRPNASPLSAAWHAPPFGAWEALRVWHGTPPGVVDAPKYREAYAIQPRAGCGESPLREPEQISRIEGAPNKPPRIESTTVSPRSTVRPMRKESLACSSFQRAALLISFVSPIHNRGSSRHTPPMITIKPSTDTDNPSLPEDNTGGAEETNSLGLDTRYARRWPAHRCSLSGRPHRQGASQR